VTEILASDPAWKSNADLIADVAALGWLNGRVLDLTHGEGVFWRRWQPDHLTTNDLHKPADHNHDARHPLPPDWVGAYDAVVFDPPYKLNGTPTDDDRYGVDRKATMDERIDLITVGSARAAEAVAGGGWLHIKVQSQISGGRYRDQVGHVAGLFSDGAFRLRAVWYFVSRPRPQPAGRRQVNPRNNVSQLLSFNRVAGPPDVAEHGEQLRLA